MVKPTAGFFLEDSMELLRLLKERSLFAVTELL